MHHNTRSSDEPSLSFWRSKLGIVLGMLAVIALFYLAREHYALNIRSRSCPNGGPRRIRSIVYA